MPIYEYQCTSCHHQFDLIQKISDEAIKECPQCHSDTATKLVSAAGFQLKGTGWYVTDFKNKPANTAPQKDTSKSTAISATHASDPKSTPKGDSA